MPGGKESKQVEDLRATANDCESRLSRLEDTINNARTPEEMRAAAEELRAIIDTGIKVGNKGIDELENKNK